MTVRDRIKILRNDIPLFCYNYSIEKCLEIKEKYPNRKEKCFAYVCAIPYLLARWLVFGIYEKTIGYISVARRNKLEKEQVFQHELGLVAIAKNEGFYIREWVSYHAAVGVSKFYIYDNGSTDNMRGEIKDFIKSGLVEYIDFPGVNRQIPAYNDAIERFSDKCRYIGFIDIDEFLVPKEDELLSVCINKIMEKRGNAAGVGVNWALYGSSGKEKKSDTPLITTFLKRGPSTFNGNAHVKTICNPRMVKNYVSPHFPIYHLGGINITPNGKRQLLWFNRETDYSIIRCNHYFCKSREEFIVKQARGMADRQQKYDFSKFEQYDRNEVFDDIMLRYADRLVQ